MTFKADYDGIGKMLTSPAMVAEMERRAQLVAAAARASAPRDTGRYAGAFEVSSGIRERKTRRAYGRVSNDTPYARLLEFGTEKTPAHRTLGRALDAAAKG